MMKIIEPKWQYSSIFTKLRKVIYSFLREYIARMSGLLYADCCAYANNTKDKKRTFYK